MAFPWMKFSYPCLLNNHQSLQWTTRHLWPSACHSTASCLLPPSLLALQPLLPWPSLNTFCAHVILCLESPSPPQASCARSVSQTQLKSHFLHHVFFFSFLSFCLFLFFFFFFFWTAPMLYGSSQARGWSRAAAASLCHSQRNIESKSHLWPTLQLTHGNTRSFNLLSKDWTCILMDTSRILNPLRYNGNSLPSFSMVFPSILPKKNPSAFAHPSPTTLITE